MENSQLKRSHVNSTSPNTDGNGRTATGFASPADDYIKKRINMHELLVGNEDATFFLRADSDALVGIGIHSGHLLVMDRSLDPKDGDLVQAVVDGELLVRIYRTKTLRPVLRAANPNYPDIELRDRSDIEIKGVITYSVGSHR